MPGLSRSTKTSAKGNEVDAYLASLPPKTRAGLQKLREIIRSAAPEAKEGISYGMPAFKLGGRPLIGFKASKDHSSLHPMSGDIVAALAGELKGYETSKGTIRFAPDRPPPASLVAKVLKLRMAELQRSAK